MTDRLDRIEQAIERTSANVDDLLGAIATTDRQVRDLRGESGDAQQRFEVLRAEAKADRDEHARRFDAQQETIQRLLLGSLDLAAAA